MDFDIVKTAKDILEAMGLYFKYLYPGFLSIWIYSFINGKSLKENKNLIVKSVIISYLYNLCYSNDVFLIISSVLLPYIYYILLSSSWLERKLEFLRIKTSLSDNILDLIKRKEKDTNKGIAVKLFLDDKGIMYEGKLRVNESDKEKEQIICLSGYRRYTKNEHGKYEVKLNNDHSGDNSRWVIIKYEDVSRIEVLYEEDK